MADRLLALKNLPNQDGFQFIGVTASGVRIPCTIKKGDDICCKVVNHYGESVFFQLYGWEKLTPPAPGTEGE